MLNRKLLEWKLREEDKYYFSTILFSKAEFPEFYGLCNSYYHYFKISANRNNMRIKAFCSNAYWKAMFPDVYAKFQAHRTFFYFQIPRLAINRFVRGCLHYLTLVFVPLLSWRDKASWSGTRLTYVNNVGVTHRVSQLLLIALLWPSLAIFRRSIQLSLVGHQLVCAELTNVEGKYFILHLSDGIRTGVGNLRKP